VTACAAVAAAIMAKRGRDPEKPKRRSSAWMLFLNDFRKDKANKNLEPKQVLPEASKSWKTLSAATKKPYEAAAKKERAAWAKASKKYMDSDRAEYWKRDPNRPKRPMSAYFFFLKEKTEKTQWKQGLAQLAKEWKDLSTAQQKPYLEKQAKAKKAFAKALAAYEASDSEEKWKKDVGIKALEDAEESRREKAKALKEKAKAQILKEKEKAKLQMANQKANQKAKALKAKARALKALKALKESKELAKSKAKALKMKEREKALKVKEMTKAKALKEKEKALKVKEKAKALKGREMVKAKALKMKEREKALKVKEMTKAKALKEKAKAKAQALKTVKKTVTKAVKTTVTKGVEKTAAKKQPVTA